MADEYPGGAPDPGQQSPGALPSELLDRIQDLTAKVDELPDVRAKLLAQELVATVIAMYGDGLRRIMEVITASREAGATILDELAHDGAVASLLLIHDLYPISLRERVLEALDTVRPYMESHGGNVGLVSLEDGVARLALEGSCNGCAASRATLELAIKQALEEHAPDLAGLEVTGVAQPAGLGEALPMAAGGFELPLVHSDPAAGGVELPLAHSEPGAGGFELPLAHSEPAAAAPAAARWVGLEPSRRPSADTLCSLEVDGVDLLLADVGGTLLAYVDECASCGSPLRDGRLHGGLLVCTQCGCEFDLPRAGRAAGCEPLQLRPVPLLEAGGLRVAV